MNKFFTQFILLIAFVYAGFFYLVNAQGPATLPYSQNFSTANDFTFVNGTQTNKWSYGTATGNAASSIYVSNDVGVSNNYTVTSTSTVQAYRDFTIPSGATSSVLSFDWKSGGESSFDYFRVWLVPATFTPTAGTQIAAGTGRIQLGGNYNLQSSWQNYLNTNLNISSFAGTTMRLVFEWRNDASAGTQPAVAIDNINLQIPTCPPPATVSVTGTTATTATISWPAVTPTPALGYQYYYSTSSTAPNATTAPSGSVSGTTTTATITPLTPNTTYYFWVRAACSPTDNSIWVGGSTFTTTQIPATLPYSQNFTTANDFGFTNGTQTNKWFYGSAAGNTGNAIYISNNGGTSNDYTITTGSTVQAYRDFTIPAGTTAASPAILSFDWRSQGESCCDYFRVWLVPTTFVPVAGTQITTGTGRIQIGGNMNLQNSWQSYVNTNVNLSSFAGTTMRLVFEWKNDGSIGTQPPAAIDNINLLIPTCKVPTALAVGTVTATGAILNWTAPNPAPANGYQYYVSTSPTPPVATTIPTGTATGTSVTLTTLSPNTTYYFWVRAVCSTTDSSIWISGPSFTTSQIPATIPYIQTFTNASGFGFTTGTMVNKWAQGAAAGNAANGLYISNDAGVTNAYTINSTSVVHAYRDIAVPAGTTTVEFDFDWKAVGESSFDYLRVWMVPASFTPTAGTQITAATGRLQVGGNYNQQANWQNFVNQNFNLQSFAGTTMRLVFEWRNDASGGTQPPAAIDNVKILICNNATPTVTLGTITHNSAVVTWNQDINGATYIVRYRPIGSTTWQTVNIAAAAFPATTNTTTLTNLLPATSYEVEVAAVCKNVAGTYSHNVFTTRCDPTPPNVTVTNITATSALVTWAPLAVSANYEIRWREVGTTGWSTPTTTPQPPANSYTITGLSSYKTYEVMVRNICVGETTPNQWSNPQVFTTVRVCDIAPPGLTITQITPTMAEVVWDAYTGTGATGNYILRYRKVGIPSWTMVTVNTNTYTITGLTELTKYEMQVANICGTTPGSCTPLYYFTTPTITYCSMSSGNSASEYINKVTVTPINGTAMTNATGATTYSDFTGTPSTFITLIQGSQGNVVKVDKTSASGSNSGVAVWIDFNRNGYFDVNEKVLSNGPNNASSASAAFTVPEDAFVSTTDYKYVVMRVAMQKDAIPVNCTSFADGEVEDYTIRIQKKPVVNTLDQTQVILYPNPVKNVLNVKNISVKAKYKIYNAAGQILASGLIVNNKIDVSRLINGLYVIDIEDANIIVQKKFIKE